MQESLASTTNAGHVEETSETAPVKKPRPAPSLLNDPLQEYRDEAWRLEGLLEAELLKDAVLSAKLAIEELEHDASQPYERRRGIRLREKAKRVEQAFNRLRALRKGDLIPPRDDE